MWLWFCTSWTSVLFPDVNELQISTMEEYRSCSLTSKLFIFPSVLIFNFRKWSHFPQVFGPHSADLAVCKFFEMSSFLLNGYIFDIWMYVTFNWDPEFSMTLLIDCWWHFINRLSNLCAGRKSGTITRQLCADKDDLSAVFYDFSIYLSSQKKYGGVHPVFFLYIYQNPFKEWSNPPFDASLEAIM